jgi:hypothetical protein
VASFTANSHSFPIVIYSGDLRLLSFLAFDHGVHGGENYIKSGLGHFLKSNVSMS